MRSYLSNVIRVRNGQFTCQNFQEPIRRVALSSGQLMYVTPTSISRQQKIVEVAPGWQIVWLAANRWTAGLEAINQPQYCPSSPSRRPRLIINCGVVGVGLRVQVNAALYVVIKAPNSPVSGVRLASLSPSLSRKWFSGQNDRDNGEWASWWWWSWCWVECWQ